MRTAVHLSLWSALLCAPAPATASTVHRCEDASGKIMFTTLGCPEGHSTSMQRAFNAPPGTNIGLLPPANLSAPTRRKPASQELVVVGTRDDVAATALAPNSVGQLSSTSAHLPA